jgi:hypothetical protein
MQERFAFHAQHRLGFGTEPLKGHLRFASLPQQFDDLLFQRPLPAVELLDVHEEVRGRPVGGRALLGRALLAALLLPRVR